MILPPMPIARVVKSWLLGATLSLAASTAIAAQANPDQFNCEGSFPNPITDICWSCVYPIKLFGVDLFSSGGEDFDSGFNNAICFCDNPPQVGVPTSFWEPVYLTDITTVPWCFPNLGGIKLEVPLKATKLGTTDDQPRGQFHGGRSPAAFRWVHGYTNPLMYVLDVLLDDSCTTKGSLSPEWPSEVDPAYDDWEISTTMNPLSFAIANMTGIVAGSVDAVWALVDFPRPELFWVAGSWGNIYPYGGWVYPHISNEATSRLISTRLLAWQHELYSMASFYGESNACSETGSWQPIMDKRQYKFSRVYPYPQTKKINEAAGQEGSGAVVTPDPDGPSYEANPTSRCCGPIGRSTILVESGTQVPASKYRDFGYVIFRKRDCCSGAWP